MMNARRALLWISFVALVAGSAAAQAPPPVGAPFGDLQVRSAPRVTEITLELPAAVNEEDRTKKRPGLSSAGVPTREAPPGAVAALPEGEATPRPEAEAKAAPAVTPSGGGEARTVSKRVSRPGALTVNEIHLFFPGSTIERPRLITVDDRIIQEARLFPDEGGVSMTVVVRRPVYYVVSRDASELHIRAEPGTLLLAESTGDLPRPSATRKAGGPRPRRSRSGQDVGGSQVQAEALVPKVTMPSMRKGEGLTIDAEHLSADQQTNEIVAQGHVTIARANSLLTADEVRIHRDSRQAQAHGNVQFTDPQGTVQADSFIGNIEDETGDLTNGSIYLSANHLSISGEKLQKSFGQTYHIENGEFTTCQCGAGPPSWSIAGDKIDITLNGYGLIDNAKLKVLEVPVFYLPKLAFPAKTTRQSGLLSPQFSYSKKRGFAYTQPFFLVLNKSADLTIAPDIETSARIGGIGEFRYALDEKSKGVLDVAFFDESLRNNAERDIVDTSIADPSIPKNRWSVTANVQQEMPFGVRAFADALAVSDDLYMREIRTFSFDPQYERTLTTSRFGSSSGGLYKSWEHATLVAQGVYYQDFIQEDDLTLQRLPQIQFFGADRFFDRHLKLGVNTEFVNFDRKQGFDGPRFDLAPTATVPFRWQEYFNGNFGLQFRETAYHLNNTDLLLPISQAGGVQTPTDTQALDKNPTREILQASAVIGTQISRVFDVGGEHVQKLKHTIEPEVDYLYVPDVNQDDLPIYDFVDRINRRNVFTYGFTTRLLAKLDKPPPIERRKKLSVGDMNPFTGEAASPFDDENTRGGLSSLGNPRLSGLEPSTDGLTAEETSRGALTPTEATAPESLTTEQRAEQRAERRQEEKSALSHVAEWARLQLFQSYDLRDSLQSNKDDHFSDFDAHLRVSPVDYFRLIYESTVNAKETSLTSASVGVQLRDPRARDVAGFLTATQRASAALSYRFISQSVLEEIDGSIVVPLADTLSVFYQSSYDALQKTFLAKIAGLRLSSQCQCWVADVLIADRVNPNETEVRFQVTLIGLGSIGRAR